MNRRGFLGMLGAAVAGIALKEAIPLGRVWSFPSKIVIPPSGNQFLTTDWITREHLQALKNHMDFGELVDYSALGNKELAIGQIIRIRTPQKYVIHTLPETDLLTGSVSHQS